MGAANIIVRNIAKRETIMKLYLYGEKLVYDESIEIYAGIRKQYKLLYEHSIEEPMKNILKIKGVGIEQFFDVIAKAHGEAFITGIEKATEILYNSGLEYASEDEFCELYNEYIDQFQADIEPIINKCCSLEEQYHLGIEHQQLQKMGRSQWVGGGFGLEGAIKGALTAKALNVGMDMFRGIKDSEIEANLSQEYKRKRDAILGSKDTYDRLCNAFYEEYMRMAECVMAELLKNNIALPLTLETTKAKALLKNSLKYKQPTQQELKNIIVECLRKDPFCKEIYDYIWEADKENNEVIKFARHFGMLPKSILLERVEKLFSMDESNTESILKKLEAYRKWELDTDQLFQKEIEDLLEKLVDFCKKDNSLVETIIKRLEIFGEAKKIYKAIGELEVIKIEAPFYDDSGEEIDNHICYSIIKDYIGVKQIYGTNIVNYILETLMFFDFEADDDGIVEELAEVFNQEWGNIVSDSKEAHSVYKEFISWVQLPLSPGDRQYATFNNEDGYNNSLTFIKLILEGAIYLWGSIPKHNETEQILAQEIKETAEFVLEHNKCIVFNDEAGKKNSVKELPSEYIDFLECVISYVKGDGESPLASKLTKREENRMHKLKYLDGFLSDCEKIKISSEKDFDEVQRLLKLSDSWKKDKRVDECREILLKYWNCIIIPQLDNMWDDVANRAPKSMDEFFNFQKRLNELRECGYLEEEEGQRFLRQIDIFMEELNSESQPEIMQAIENFDFENLSEENYNQAKLFLEWSETTDVMQESKAISNIKKYVKEYGKKNKPYRNASNNSSQNQLEQPSKLAITTLILGISAVLTICLCIGGPLGIVGLVCGTLALKRKDNSHNMAMTGIIMSGIAVLLSVIVVIIAVFLSEAEEKNGLLDGSGSLGLEETSGVVQEPSFISEEVLLETETVDVVEEGIDDGYVFADSDSSYLTEAEITVLSMEEKVEAYYEIPARKGIIFNDGEVQAFFEQKKWYKPLAEESEFDISVLNEYENVNMQLIQSIVQRGLKQDMNSEETSTAEDMNAPESEISADYILPESNSRYYESYELSELTKEELRLARNEIYARHGRMFETEDLNQYFSSQPWYTAYLSADEFDDSVFNGYEKANLELIKSVEDEKASTGIATLAGSDVDWYLKYEEIETEVSSLYNNVSSQEEYTKKLMDEYQQWDKFLNEIYQYLKALYPDHRFEKIREDQRNWLKERDQAANQAIVDADGEYEDDAYYYVMISKTKERSQYLMDECLPVG